MMTNEKKHKRPKYSLEFKQDAAKLVLKKGYSQQQAADHPHRITPNRTPIMFIKQSGCSVFPSYPPAGLL